MSIEHSFIFTFKGDLMNIFLPFESFKDCAETLDDRRLTKQILECKQILDLISNKKNDATYHSPYLNHPVVHHYFYSENFICAYALCMCQEFEYRFNHKHTYHEYFAQHYVVDKSHETTSIIYVEGSKNSNSCIRETRSKKVHELFRKKLCKKWNEDIGRIPLDWTNRPVPIFYLKELDKHAKKTSH